MSTQYRFLSLCLTGIFWVLWHLSPAQTAVDSKSPVRKATAVESPAVVQGRQLFQTTCSACHNFLQRGIGPNLAQIPAYISSDWLRKFIKNAPALITAGNKRANDLYADYKIMMPAFPQLSDQDLEALVSYLDTKQTKTASDLLAASAFGPVVNDPIPQKIASSGLALWLDEVATAPVTNTPPAVARVNTMRTIKQGAAERQFITDMQGILYEIRDTTLKPVLNVRNQFPQFINKPGYGTGLGSFAFHPLFNQNGLLYTTHSEKPKSAPADFNYADSIKVTMQWVLTEWKIDDPLAATFTGKNRELMRIDVISPIHGMQEIAFNPVATNGNPDFGLLYISVGDGGATENGYYFLCADKRSVWGKLLRINPLGRTSKNGRYGIPADNPRASTTAAPNEVFCRGFRNPNRFSWTPDGKLLVSDIGQTNAEELNWAVKGADYGWPNREGTYLMNHRARMDRVYNLPANEKPGQYRYPIAWYDHDEGNAISGGYVYAGNEMPLLGNKYVFGDVAQGRIFCVDMSKVKQGRQTPVQEMTLYVNGQQTTLKALNQNRKPDCRIGEGPNHTLYFFTKTNGKIYRVSDCKTIH